VVEHLKFQTNPFSYNLRPGWSPHAPYKANRNAIWEGGLSSQHPRPWAFH
jgi:hypothetical protein